MKNKEKPIWVKLYNYDDYQVSNLGGIRSLVRTKTTRVGAVCTFPSVELKARRTKKNPNLFTEIHLDNTNSDKQVVRKTIYLQKAVGDHFVEKPKINTELYQFTTHINDDYNNNRYDNIKWVTKEDLTIMEQKTKFKKGIITKSSKL